MVEARYGSRPILYVFAGEWVGDRFAHYANVLAGWSRGGARDERVDPAERLGLAALAVADDHHAMGRDFGIGRAEAGAGSPLFRLSAEPRVLAPAPQEARTCIARDLCQPFRCVLTARPAPANVSFRPNLDAKCDFDFLSVGRVIALV